MQTTIANFCSKFLTVKKMDKHKIKSVLSSIDKNTFRKLCHKFPARESEFVNFLNEIGVSVRSCNSLRYSSSFGKYLKLSTAVLIVSLQLENEI
jgi:hypothetical protein